MSDLLPSSESVAALVAQFETGLGILRAHEMRVLRRSNQLVTVTGSMSGTADEFADFGLQQKKLEDLSSAVSTKPVPLLTAPAAPPAATAPLTRGVLLRADEPAPLSALQIQGKVRVGTGPERELKALRVTR